MSLNPNTINNLYGYSANLENLLRFYSMEFKKRLQGCCFGDFLSDASDSRRQWVGHSSHYSDERYGAIMALLLVLYFQMIPIFRDYCAVYRIGTAMCKVEK